MHITPELEAELNDEPVEKAVDKVLDGIDAAKVREKVIETIDSVPIETWLDDEDIELIVDELMQNFIITPRS